MTLATISPSSINTFDETTPFGCERRWYFKYVLKHPEPQSDNLILGQKLHTRNEEYITKRLIRDPSDALDAQALELFKVGVKCLDLLVPSLIQVEQPMPEGFTVGGVKVHHMSKCDVVTANGIIDWKTTADIGKYGKTPGQLAKDSQMLIYAKAFHADKETVILSHGQYQTKGRPKFNRVDMQVSQNSIDERMGEFIIPLVEKMKQTYNAPAAKEVKPNRAACWRCPHKGICPADKENPLMSVFNKFKKTDTAVTPPDAPKSNPAAAAKPVEGTVPEAVAANQRKMLIVDVTAPAGQEVKTVAAPTAAQKAREAAAKMLAEAEAAEKAEQEALAAEEKAREEAEKKAIEEATVYPDEATQTLSEESTEEEKRGRGRPPGAKNKPKAPPVVTVVSAPSGPARFTKTTVNFGVTMNLGDYNSARIDVSHTVEYGDGDADAAFKTAYMKAQAQCEAEAQRIEEELEAAGSK